MSQAAPCTPPVTNQVACENTLPGRRPEHVGDRRRGRRHDPGLRDADERQQGRHGLVQDQVGHDATTTSTSCGSATTAATARGWSRRTSRRPGPSTQPACHDVSTTGLIDCGNWSVSASWTVPSTAVSGVYIAHLVRNDTGGVDSQITFVVRDDSSHSDVVVQTSDETWQAYNTYGGNSLYQCTVACPPGDPAAYKAAYKVSYNRPFDTAEDDGGRSWLFTGGEYPMIRFLERNGYDVSYVSGADVGTARLAAAQPQAVHVQRPRRVLVQEPARRASRRRATRASTSPSSAATRCSGRRAGSRAPPARHADRTLVAYKDTHFHDRSRTRSSGPAPGATRASRPARRTTRRRTRSPASRSWSTPARRAITVPAAYRKLRMWRNTRRVADPRPERSRSRPTRSATSGTSGRRQRLPARRPVRPLLDDGERPRGVHRLRQHDQARTATATHNLTMYRAPERRAACSAPAPCSGPGASTATTPTSNDAGPQHAAGDGQPVRRHGRPAGDAAVRPGRGHGVDRHTPRRRRRSRSLPLDRRRRHPGDAHRHRDRRRRRRRRRRRGLDRRRHAPGTPRPGRRAGRTRGRAHGNPSHDDQGPRRRRQRQPGDAGRRRDRERHAARARSGARTTPPAPTSTRATRRRSRSASSSSPTSYGTISGLRFYKAAANTGTHIGHACGPPTASCWRRRPSRARRASGWQTVTFSQPGRDPAGHDLRRVLLRAQRPLLRDVGLLLARAGARARTAAPCARQPAAARHPQHRVDAATASTRTAPTSTFPSTPRSAANYWVDVIFSPTAAPGQVTGRQRDRRRAHVGERVLDGAVDRRRADVLHRSRRTSARRRRRRRPSPARRRPRARRSPASRTGTTYTFKVDGAQPDRRRARSPPPRTP